MNVKLTYTTNFIAGVWWDSRLVLSSYTVTFKMITASDSAQDTNTALDRLRYIVEEHLLDTVFIKDTDQEQIALLQAAGITTILLPEEPVDQIIGMMLYAKLSAVMEGIMLIRSIMLSSTAGDDVIYEHDAQESAAPFDQPGWWNESTPTCVTQSHSESVGSVVVLNAVNQWGDLGLAWISDVEPDQASNVLLFAEFKNDKDK